MAKVVAYLRITPMFPTWAEHNHEKNVSHDTICPVLGSNREFSKKNLGLYPYANLLCERKVEKHLGREENLVLRKDFPIRDKRRKKRIR